MYARGYPSCVQIRKWGRRSAGERNRAARWPVALLVVVAVGAVTAALTGAAKPVSGLEFLQSGHWVVNLALGQAVHVDGASKKPDGQVPLPHVDQGSQVVQSPTSGYVVGSADVTEFDKSTLSVERTSPLPSDGERPLAVEVAGGPYLVYAGSGQVVRLGSEPKILSAGRGLGSPVTTDDATLWMHRAETGAICSWARGADELSCPATAPAGHAGGLTVNGGKPVFVDATEGTMSTVEATGMGVQKPLGLRLPPTARVAPADVAGKIAVLDPDTDRLHLVSAGSNPVTVVLPAGEYSSPSVTGTSVVLLDRGNNVLRTYGGDGRERKTTPIPVEKGEPRLSRGEDARVYVDGAEGKHVVVVDGDGSITPVPVQGKGELPPQPTPVQPPPATVATPDRQPPVRQEPAPPVTPSRQPQKQVPPPAPPPPPPPIPATPPGMPGNLAVRIAAPASDATVTWTAAPANGAPVTGYVVTWVREDGSRPGSATVPGLSHVIAGIWSGRDVAFTVTVAAVNSAGRGTPASVRTAATAQPTITLSRGGSASKECGEPNCAWMRMVFEGFEPGATLDVMPHSSHPGYSNPGHRLRADSAGNANLQAFYYHGVGHTVWVTAGGVTSNRLTWTAG
ncbi:hypothetical protein GCM10017774_43030 [Lentzea cavernae]|uniref:Fibronectin type-III domain-containing protein n=1 Tax=Lentzea cavernae TaxID=2020703 RepID=A0ABQ3MML3_9PSEU|nr:hypothetical protein GCM10017774_43030 [Lentzea cavernae]